MTESSPSPERWLSVVGYEGLYEVSDLGRVRSLDREVVAEMPAGRPRTRPGPHIRHYAGRILKSQVNAHGYLTVTLSRNGRAAVWPVHLLVLPAFAESRPPDQEARHGPGGKQNARLENLCWGTRSENQLDRARDGTSNRGERCAAGKLTAAIVAECQRRYAAGETQTALAREFGVNQSSVSEAIRGVTWAPTS